MNPFPSYPQRIPTHFLQYAGDFLFRFFLIRNTKRTISVILERRDSMMSKEKGDRNKINLPHCILQCWSQSRYLTHRWNITSLILTLHFILCKQRSILKAIIVIIHSGANKNEHICVTYNENLSLKSSESAVRSSWVEARWVAKIFFAPFLTRMK